MDYRVIISDRSRARTVRNVLDAQEAIRVACGARLINSRHDCSAADGSYAMYEIAVQTGPARGGATPFRNIHARVEVV